MDKIALIEKTAEQLLDEISYFIYQMNNLNECEEIQKKKQLMKII